MTELRGIVPQAFKAFLFPQVQQQIINDWLLWEITQYAEDVYPILREIRGWRRLEVIAYCESQRYLWDERLAETYNPLH